MTYIDKKKIEENKNHYSSSDREFAFLLGGIGTGSISIGSRGELKDFEIFNHPNKNQLYPFNFFSLYSRFEGEEPEFRILESRHLMPYARPNGYVSFEVAGVPRFEDARLTGYGPFVEVELLDKSLPLDVKMVAFSPLIPTNPDDSGIPAISIKYVVKNVSGKKCEVSVCQTQSNLTSQDGFDLFNNMIIPDTQHNEFFEDGELHGILFSSSAPKGSTRYGTMAIATNDSSYSAKPEWLVGGWCDGIHDFVDEFRKDGTLSLKSRPSEDKEASLEFVSPLRTGSLAVKHVLEPNEEREFNFIISWCFPNRLKSWEGHICPARDPKGETIPNYYSIKHPDALSAMRYLYHNFDYLHEASLAYVESLFSSSLSKEVIDAVNGTMTVLRSTTCFRVGEEGKFLCWEGSFEKRGSCEGNCTHVWNYAQTLAYLYPSLAADMDRTNFLIETDDKGNMAFRTMQVLGDEKWKMIPAADGQFGAIVRLYRDWKITGDGALLADCYPHMKKALDFAFDYWDENGDCVLDGKQHNTYDIEFYGENSLVNSLFFAALRAGVEMATAMKDGEAASRWNAAFINGSALMDKKLFKNGYYVQKLKDVYNVKYQYGDGCLSDQILGQTLASIAGLGYILPAKHVHEAIENIYRNNYRKSLLNHENVQRVYALNDESGLLLCTWPNGTTRPRIPFIYADEVWTGIEYQVATELIYEGFIEEGLEIVKGTRSRFSGKNRNPYNEMECGNHYARSLASYGVLLALSGQDLDYRKKVISFNETLSPMTFPFTTPKAFGIVHINGKKIDVEVLYGDVNDLTFVTK